VEALLERRRTDPSTLREKYVDGTLVIDFRSHTCVHEDEVIQLTPTETALLQHLVARRGTVVSRTELRSAVWEESDDVALRTVDRHITKIRAKLEPIPSAPTHLQTVYGKGYRFVASAPVPTAPYVG
jgi:DNA-binding response OmpR family regulator